MKGFDMNPLPLFALAILAAVGLWWWLVPAPTRTIPEQFTPEERQYYAERHRYHGIGGSVRDLRTGEESFERGGRNCKL